MLVKQWQSAAHSTTLIMQHWSRIPTSFCRQLCQVEKLDVQALFVFVLKHDRCVPKVTVHNVVNIKSKYARSCNWPSAMKPCKGESAASHCVKGHADVLYMKILHNIDLQQGPKPVCMQQQNCMLSCEQFLHHVRQLYFNKSVQYSVDL